MLDHTFVAPVAMETLGKPRLVPGTNPAAFRLVVSLPAVGLEVAPHRIAAPARLTGDPLGAPPPSAQRRNIAASSASVLISPLPKTFTCERSLAVSWSIITSPVWPRGVSSPCRLTLEFGHSGGVGMASADGLDRHGYWAWSGRGIRSSFGPSSGKGPHQRQLGFAAIAVFVHS